MSVVGDVRGVCRWLAEQDPGLVVAVMCAEHPDAATWSRDGPQRGIDVIYRFETCLTHIPAAPIVDFIASGVGHLTVLLDGCAEPNRSATVVAQWAELLEAAGRRGVIAQQIDAPLPSTSGRWRRRRECPVYAASSVPTSRRRLLGLAGDSWPEPSTYPHERTAHALRRLLAGRPTPTGLHALSSGVPDLRATGCIGSGVCVRTCPQDALDLHTQATPEGERFTLTVDPHQCMDCTDCVDICPQAALKVTGERSWGELVDNDDLVVAQGPVLRCRQCRAPFAGAGTLCEVCTFRRSNPFGSWRPPRRDLSD